METTPLADQPKGREASRSPGQDKSSLQADVSVPVARHRYIMSIDNRRLITAGKRLARVAGGVYLLIVALGGLAHLAARAGIYVPGYAANTAQNIAASPIHAPVGLAADLGIAAVLVFVGITVYLLLRRIDRHASGVLVVVVAVAAGLVLINLLFHHAALLVATDSGSTAVGSHRADGLVVLLLDMHDHGYTITGPSSACGRLPWAISPTSPVCSPGC